MPLDSSRSPILLKDLKLWQDDYDNLFQKCHTPHTNGTRGPSPQMKRDEPEDWDGKAISPTKPFEQLLEEKLAEYTPEPASDKPKRPFLKKGEGLARFRMSRCMKSNKKRQFKDDKPIPNTAKSRNNKTILEEPALSNTETAKDPSLSTGKCQNLNRLLHPQIVLSPLEIPDFVKPRGTWHTLSEGRNSFEQFPDDRDCVGKKTNEIGFSITSNDIPDDISKVLPNLCMDQSAEMSERELKLFEVLEQRTNRSSFSSTNTSILNLLSSTPHREVKRTTGRSNIRFQDLNRYFDLQKTLQNNDVLQNFLLNLKKLDDCRNSDSDSSAKTSVRNSMGNFSDDERWSSRSTSPSPVRSTEPSDTDVSTRIDVGVNTSFNVDVALDETIKEPCSECDKLSLEIGRLRTENVKLKNDKKQSERLEKEREKCHREELVKLKEELDAERKKFGRERAVFETYVKEAQNRPTKQERAEITRLKQELADVKEMMKLKDSKSGATQARLRTHSKQLEKEILELKTTVEKLQKENAKLSASQKFARRPSEVKMLHEINKNLSKLTEGALKQQLNKSGGGNGDYKQGKENKDDSKQQSIKDDKSVDDDGSIVEKQYEHVFGKFDSPRPNSTSITEKTERTLEDGTIEIRYGNGNIRTITPDGNIVTVKYFNGDVKETNVAEKTIRYHYSENDTWHTQYADGTELIEYKDGQKSKRYEDGKVEITYPDGSVRLINTDGTEEERFPDGSKTIMNGAGERIIFLPNGQKEVHTREFKRREYPDGTARTLYPDGTVETVYPNGRVRVKDAHGVLIKDTHQQATT